MNAGRWIGAIVALLWAALAPVAYACGGGSCSESGGCAGGLGCGCGCGAIGSSLDGNPGEFPIQGAAAFNSKNVELVGHLTMAQMSMSGTTTLGSGIWGWRDPETGREYALYGKEFGVAFVDITNPTTPRYMGDLRTHTSGSIWRELATYGNHLYVVSDSNGAHGVQIFDLKGLRSVGPGDAPIQFAETAWYNGEAGGKVINNVHTIHINEQTGFAYLNGSGTYSGGFGGSFHAISLANPTAPVLAGNRTMGYVHDGQTVLYDGPDTDYVGREISINSMSTNGLSVLDVTNKTATVELARKTYPHLGYTHQGWFTEDQRFFIANDELDEYNLPTGPQQTSTHIWDLLDLNNPRYLGAFVHDTVAIDHNLFIQGNLVYMSNYTSGLRVYDLSNLSKVADGSLPISAALSLVGYFDTYYQDDATPQVSFNGTWGNYPFFPSGNIIVGDRNNGLFILRLTGNAVDAPEPLSLILLSIGGIGALLLRRR